MFYQETSYDMENFSNSNIGCPITGISIDETTIAGKVANIMTSAGTSIQITTLFSDDKIKISIPESNIILEKYYFRI